jgi:site-specific DNA-methyltransferase (adenine-specific)
VYTLHHGDCLQIIPTLSGIDTVVTDPPFNAGKSFENDDLSALDFRAFCNRFALALYALKPKNILVEVGKNDIVMRQELERYFTYRYSICLNYTNSMRNGAIGYANWGLVLWFSNGGKCHNRYKDRLDSALHNTKGIFEHPSPKEVDHYRHLCRMFTDDGGTVLDPFMGSGTTGIAALEEQRNFVGIELDAGYFDIARRRIEQVQPALMEAAD